MSGGAAGRALGWVNPTQYGRGHFGRSRQLSAGARAGLPPKQQHANLPPAYQQGSVGSCVAESLACATEILGPRSGYVRERPDRGDLYWRARREIGTQNEDSGAIIADGVKALRRGWVRETEHPETWGEFWTRRRNDPPNDAPRLFSAEPLSLDADTILYNLALGGVVVVGLQVTGQWFEATGQYLERPEGEVVGGHAIALVGYDVAGYWLAQNSWGEDWATEGRIWIPWDWTSPPWCGEAFSLRSVLRTS